MPLTVLVKKKLRKAWLWASTPRKATKLDVVVVAVALAMAYYFAVARPARQREDAALQAQADAKLRSETVTRQVDLDKCLTAAQRESDRLWTVACKAKGRSARCTLSRRETDEHRQDAGRVRNACLIKHALSN